MSLTQTETANRLGISTSWLRELSNRGVIERTADGAYLWPQARASYGAYLASVAPSRGGPGRDSEWEQARARREVARARLAELEVAESEGELIPIEAVSERFGRRLDVLRAGLLNMPGRWGAQVVGIETETAAVEVLERIAVELVDAIDLREVRDDG